MRGMSGILLPFCFILFLVLGATYGGFAAYQYFRVDGNSMLRAFRSQWRRWDFSIFLCLARLRWAATLSHQRS